MCPDRDAIPPYKLGSKKQLQREMQRNMRMNGQVSLPPFPVSVLAILLNYIQTTPTSPPIKKHYPLTTVDCSCCCALSGIMTLNKVPHHAKWVCFIPGHQNQLSLSESTLISRWMGLTSREVTTSNRAAPFLFLQQHPASPSPSFPLCLPQSRKREIVG